jgi:uncharacterized protein YjbJ (UPF0337 family)
VPEVPAPALPPSPQHHLSRAPLPPQVEQPVYRTEPDLARAPGPAQALDLSGTPMHKPTEHQRTAFFDSLSLRRSGCYTCYTTDSILGQTPNSRQILALICEGREFGVCPGINGLAGEPSTILGGIPMNIHEVKGKFNELKGDFKMKWGELTDDDWKQVSGSKDKLLGILQQKYGRSKEQAQREVDEYMKEEKERKIS